MNKMHWLAICVFLVLVAMVLILLHLIEAALPLILVAVALALIRFVMVEKGMAGSSLTLGIIGILLGWLPLAGIIGAIFFSIPALILGIVSVRRKKRIGLSRAGIILGAIGVAYFLYIIIASLIEIH